MARRWLAALNLWLLFGLCMFCGAISSIQDTIRTMNSGIKVEGEIVSVAYGSRYTPLTVRVRFRTADGVEVTARAQGGQLSRYQEGQRVTVYYTPGELETVYLPEYLWFTTTVLVVVGLMLGGFSLWVGLRKSWTARDRV